MKPQVQGLCTIFDTNTQGPFIRHSDSTEALFITQNSWNIHSGYFHISAKMKVKGMTNRNANIHHCRLFSVHYRFPLSYLLNLLWMGLGVQIIFGFSQVSCVLLERGSLPGLAPSRSGVNFCAEQNAFLTRWLRGFALSCLDEALRRWNCRDKIHIHLVQLN